MDEAAEADFDALLRIAGIAIPADRRAAMLDAYRSHRRMVAVLREPMPLATEPAAAPMLKASGR